MSGYFDSGWIDRNIENEWVLHHDIHIATYFSKKTDIYPERNKVLSSVFDLSQIYFFENMDFVDKFESLLMTGYKIEEGILPSFKQKKELIIYNRIFFLLAHILGLYTLDKNMIKDFIKTISICSEKKEYLFEDIELKKVFNIEYQRENKINTQVFFPLFSLLFKTEENKNGIIDLKNIDNIQYWRGVFTNVDKKKEAFEIRKLFEDSYELSVSDYFNSCDEIDVHMKIIEEQVLNGGDILKILNEYFGIKRRTFLKKIKNNL